MTTLIIPAAGRATRLRPLTSNCSKAMVPVNGRPAIAYILDQASWADEIIVVDGELDDIRDFCKRYENVKCVKQGSLNGPRDAFHVGFLHSNGKGPVVCWMSDTICPDLVPALTDCVYTHPVDDPKPFCMTDGRTYEEKPDETQFTDALIGVYCFEDRRRLASALKQTADKSEMSSLLKQYAQWMRPLRANMWLDVGNIDGYHRARAELLNRSSREFNSIYVDTFLGTITKQSATYDGKVQQEKSWYGALDEWQKLFVPRVLPGPVNSLVMSLESGIPLSDLLVYDDLPTATWKSIIDKVFAIMHRVMYRPISNRPQHLRMMYIDKPVGRLANFAPDLKEWARQVGEHACKSAKYSQVIHGDMQLGNIIYDPYTGKIKLVDPRGYFGEIGTEGDQQYDIAKMFMDIYWGFNSILAGVGHQRSDVAAHLALKAREYGYDDKLMIELGLVLLVSTVPFHDDNPRAQERFIELARRRAGLGDDKCLTASLAS